jgi:ubiquinone/menaquinone biosynthesis C-methylase UbiE
LSIINGDVFQSIQAINDCEFEGVLFSHVMEHVDSPIVMLREINRVMNTGGTLILGLPTERNVFRDLLGMDYFNGTHIYAFSVRNAHKLLSETGFRVEKIFYHLPKCRNQIGRTIEKMWNVVNWPFREYFSMAYWIIAIKQ